MRLPSPRALAAAGLVLLAAAGIAIGVRALTGGPHHPLAGTTASTTTSTAPAPTTTAPPPTTAPAPPPPPPGVSATRDGVSILDARVTATTPFSATVEWRTRPETRGRVAAALGSLPPTLWSESDAPAAAHSITLGGLAFGSSYVLAVSAVAGDGHSVDVSLPLTTPAPDGSSLLAATRGDAITLAGQPFFPLLVWGECPAAYGPVLAAGVNLLAENPCGGVGAQVDALAGGALSASVAGEADMEHPSVIGWFLPDEADARGMTAATLPSVPSSATTGRLTFLTLSNHFFSLTSPPPGGRGIYPGLIAKADVVGFDLYPLQTMCWPDRIGAVYDAQRELEQLAAGKPTFQWIEAGTMSCPATGATAITPAVVRAESWLAIAGGADGLGFFPGEWTPAIAAAIRSVTDQVKAIAPALLAPPVAAGSAGSGMRVAAHALDGALYVIAVNPTRSGAAATVRVAGLGERSLQPLDGGSVLTAQGDAVRIVLPPLGAAVYVAPPAA